MSSTTTATAGGQVGGRGGIRREVVAALAITTTVSYGVLYYAFSVVLEPMRTDLRISTTAATGALTLASLTSAGCAGRREITHCSIVFHRCTGPAPGTPSVSCGSWSVRCRFHTCRPV